MCEGVCVKVCVCLCVCVRGCVCQRAIVCCGRAHMNIYAEHETLNSASCIYFIVSIGFVT